MVRKTEVPTQKLDVDHLAHEIWRETEQKHSLVRVRHAVVEAARQFENASVPHFVPILVRRIAQDSLAELTERNSTV